MGKKAARAVPLVTNCHHGPHVWRKRRYRLPGIVANYRTFAPGVDVCNQLCLQHREERRFPNWWTNPYGQTHPLSIWTNTPPAHMDKHPPCPYGQTHHLSIWTNTPPVHMDKHTPCPYGQTHPLSIWPPFLDVSGYHTPSRGSDVQPLEKSSFLNRK